MCNLYLARNGDVYVCAGGATNTNGSGHDPCGVTPDDSMNSHAIGIEAGNNGTGEQWPTVQQDAYVTMIQALCDHYGIPVERVHSHFEYAPDRKIDPAGNSRYASGGNKWDMDAFRGDITAGGPPPQPPPEEEEVTRDDAKMIAEEVWNYMINDPTVAKMTQADVLLGYTRAAAGNADRQTRPSDAKNTIAEDVWSHPDRTLT